MLICGAEKLPPPLAVEFQEKFGVLPLEGYGCTELSPVVSTNLADQPCGGVAQVYNRVGTVGAPMPGVAARVVDPETFAPLPAGAEGLLLVTGANVMAGYLNQPELTAKVMRDGWYVTGDMARIDAEGHIAITGRLSRFAKIGGEMVPLEKVEEALHEVLGAAERVCAVACVPDETRGERLAQIERTPGSVGVIRVRDMGGCQQARLQHRRLNRSRQQRGAGGSIALDDDGIVTPFGLSSSSVGVHSTTRSGLTQPIVARCCGASRSVADRPTTWSPLSRAA